MAGAIRFIWLLNCGHCALRFTDISWGDITHVNEELFHANCPRCKKHDLNVISVDKVVER